MNSVDSLLNILLFRRWPFCCLLFFAVSCTNTPATNKLVITRQDSLQQEELVKRSFHKIDSIGKFIHNGDLVTRTGNDFTSESLRSLNQHDKTYSHCGIASIEHDSIFIYHALGGDFNPDQKIRRDPLDLFAEPYSNRGIGIFRFEVPPTCISNITDTTRQLFHLGVMFDLKFDLDSDDRMYCAEFVCKSLNRGSHNLLAFNYSHLGDFKFIGVDDLFLHPLCKEISRISYK